MHVLRIPGNATASVDELLLVLQYLHEPLVRDEILDVRLTPLMHPNRVFDLLLLARQIKQRRGVPAREAGDDGGFCRQTEPALDCPQQIGIDPGAEGAR